MPAPASQFVLLQDKVKAQLEADAMFISTPGGKPIPVYTERKGDLLSVIETALGTLSGICAIIYTPDARMINPKGGKALDLVAPIRVQIQEDVTTNQSSGTKVPALNVVQRVMELLHFWNPGILYGDNKTVRLHLEETPFLLLQEDPTLIYEVMFSAPLNLSAPTRT